MFITRTFTLDLSEKEIKEHVQDMFEDYGICIYESTIKDCIKRLVGNCLFDQFDNDDDAQEWFDCLTDEQYNELRNQIIQYFKEYAIMQIEETIKSLSK